MNRLKNNRVKFKTSGKTTNHYIGIYKMYLTLIINIKSFIIIIIIIIPKGVDM